MCKVLKRTRFAFVLVIRSFVLLRSLCRRLGGFLKVHRVRSLNKDDGDAVGNVN